MNKNKQQELLRKALNQKSKSLGLAAIMREVGEKSTDYGISFYAKKGIRLFQISASKLSFIEVETLLDLRSCVVII